MASKRVRMLSQERLFEARSLEDELWGGMPDYQMVDTRPLNTKRIKLGRGARGVEHYKALERFMQRERGTKLNGFADGARRSYFWHPYRERRQTTVRWGSRQPLQPRYPIYIPSKSRWEKPYTVRALQRLGIEDFLVTVEPQQKEQYAAVVGKDRLLVVPHRDQGVVPTRNSIWEHAASRGARRYWTFDDNIQCFYRLHENTKVPLACPNFLRAIEDWSDRFSNLVVSGMQYEFFAPQNIPNPPVYLNARVYSNMLLLTDACDQRGEPFRWEGFYNEDTDLCLRVMKNGQCCALTYAFLARKMRTMQLGGGNTVNYQGDGRYRMAKELADKHPDVTTIIEKWGRHQHLVDYTRFRKNKLLLEDGVEIPDEPDEYGMELEPLSEGERKLFTLDPEAYAGDRGDEVGKEFADA